MTRYSNYLINVLQTNGDIFARHYSTMSEARIAWASLKRNPLVVHASLHNREDDEVAEISQQGAHEMIDYSNPIQRDQANLWSRGIDWCVFKDGRKWCCADCYGLPKFKTKTAAYDAVTAIVLTLSRGNVV